MTLKELRKKQKMDKLLKIEVIICFSDNSWTTDCVSIPYPDDDDFSGDLKCLVLEKSWEKIEKMGSQCKPVYYVGIYSVNWDDT